VPRPRAEGIAVLVGYAVVSCAYFGWRLLPHPGRVMLGEGSVPFIWSMAWWPHAIGSWTNPLVSHAVYAPTGVNIAWTPTAPGLALVFSPLTVLFGPVASYNVAMLLMPALAAWTAYLLCRYLTRSLWASVVGGLLFGFSTAELRQVQPGFLNLAGVFLFPVVALLILRYIRDELDGRGLVWRLGLALAFQLTISTEFAAELAAAIALCLALGYVLVPDRRRRIRSSLFPVVGAYLLSVLVVAPFAYYLVSGFQGSAIVDDIDQWGTDLLGFVVPAYVNGLGGTDLAPTSLAARVPSHSAYLGLPTILIVIAYGVRNRRSAGARFLLAAFGLGVVVTLGATFRVYGHTLFSLPWWRLLSHAPGLNDALPFRLAVFSALGASVIVATWMATTGGRFTSRPVILPVLAVIAIAPAVWRTSNQYFNPVHPTRLAFFTSDVDGTCLTPGEVVAVFPFSGHSLLWQAESNFSFRLAADGLQPFPKYAPLNAFDADPIVFDLIYGERHPPMQRLLAFAGKHRVARFLSVAADGYPTRAQMAALGPTGLVGGMLVAPACGRSPLTSRDLGGYVTRYGNQPGKRPKIAWCIAGRFFTHPEGSEPTGANAGATQAIFVEGVGLTCGSPPPGYTHHGYADPSLGVPAGIYPYYSP
jgi:hypothetical protein